MTATLYMFEMAADQPWVFSAAQLAELADLERRCDRVFDRRETAALVFRLSRAAPQVDRSLRLPPEWVLTAGRPPQRRSEEVK